MADLGLRGRRLRQTLRVLRVDLEVRVVARVAERGIDVVPYGIHRAGLPDAGSCGDVVAGTELPPNHAGWGVRRIGQSLAPREERLDVLDLVHDCHVHGSPPFLVAVVAGQRIGSPGEPQVEALDEPWNAFGGDHESDGLIFLMAGHVM